MVNEPQDLWGGLTSIFSLGKQSAFGQKFANQDNDVRWLLGVLREGKRKQVEEALKLLEEVFKSDTLKTMSDILEDQSLPVLMNIALFNSNLAAKNHALAVILSLSEMEDFKEIALQEGVVGMMVEGMGCCNRANSVSIGEILKNLLDSSPALVEEFVLVDGIGHGVRWVEHGDKRLRALGLDLLLSVSQERDDFRALMAVEGCVQAVLTLLDSAVPQDHLKKATLLLGNISYNYDVRSALSSMTTIKVLLNNLSKGYKSVDLNALTIFANLSVLPRARKIMKASRVVCAVVELLADESAEFCSIAVCFLSNMAADSSGRIQIRESGAIPKLIDLLSTDDKRLAAHALGNLVKDKDMGKLVIENCSIEVFVEMLRDDNSVSRENAVRVLSQLCTNELVHEDIIRLRVPCHLVDLFADSVADTRRLAMVCIAALAKNNQFTSSSFIKECVAGVVKLLGDESLECRNQACATLASLVGGSPEVEMVAIEHCAVDKLLTIMNDDRDLAPTKSHVAVCLHHLSRKNKLVLRTIADANVIPRLNKVIHGSNIETKIIVSELVTHLAELLSLTKNERRSGLCSSEMDTSTCDDGEARPASSWLHRSVSTQQETPESPFLEGDHGPSEEGDTDLQVLAQWFQSRNANAALSAEDINQASMMPRRLLSALAQELVTSQREQM